MPSSAWERFVFGDVQPRRDMVSEKIEEILDSSAEQIATTPFPGVRIIHVRLYQRMLEETVECAKQRRVWYARAYRRIAGDVCFCALLPVLALAFGLFCLPDPFPWWLFVLMQLPWVALAGLFLTMLVVAVRTCRQYLGEALYFEQLKERASWTIGPDEAGPKTPEDELN